MPENKESTPQRQSKDNELWWAQHGREWYEECLRRRVAIPYYMLQEVFLSGYFGMAGPGKALEFGCGFCRHLRYLRYIPGLDIMGCDQSPTMLAQAAGLVEQSWLDKHVVPIKARESLPWPDKSFDIVYTASVLIHIQPCDVRDVVKELIRVARGHILHIENPPTGESICTCAEHDGCWAHPLKEIYADLGVKLETLSAYDSFQGVYRAVLNECSIVPDVTSFSQRLRETESAWQGQIDARQGIVEGLSQELAQREQRLSATAGELEAARAQGAALSGELAALRGRYEELAVAEARFRADLARTFNQA
jgi:ubiquinone/menaquinone biosynthesis C-methylase UbiE